MITIEQKEEITRLHQIGVRIISMPQLTGINKNQIREFLNSDEFTGKRRNFAWNTKKLREVAKKLKEGKLLKVKVIHLIKEIAYDMGTKYSVIERAIYTHKLHKW